MLCTWGARVFLTCTVPVPPTRDAFVNPAVLPTGLRKRGHRVSCTIYSTQRHLGCHGGKLKALRIWQCFSKLYTNIYILLNNSLPFVYLLAGSVAYTIHKPRLSFFQTNKRTRESSTNLETNILTTTRYTAKKRRFRTNYRDILHPILNPTCSSRPHHRRILTRGTNSPKHYIYSSQHTILFSLSTCFHYIMEQLLVLSSLNISVDAAAEQSPL